MNLMLVQITAILDENLGRVENLISLYGPETRGRRTVEDTDVLRGALVLLHAGMGGLPPILDGLEDQYLQRGYAKHLRLPRTTPSARQPKSLLASWQRIVASQLTISISYAVKSHLEEYQSFNNLGEVTKALKQCGISANAVEANNFGKLTEMIARRHNIVHKADRNDVAVGQGNHKTKSLRKSTIEAYVGSIKSLRDFVSANL